MLATAVDANRQQRRGLSGHRPRCPRSRTAPAAVASAPQAIGQGGANAAPALPGAARPFAARKWNRPAPTADAHPAPGREPGLRWPSVATGKRCGTSPHPGASPPVVRVEGRARPARVAAPLLPGATLRNPPSVRGLGAFLGAFLADRRGETRAVATFPRIFRLTPSRQRMIRWHPLQCAAPTPTPRSRGFVLSGRAAALTGPATAPRLKHLPHA